MKNSDPIFYECQKNIITDEYHQTFPFGSHEPEEAIVMIARNRLNFT